MDIGKHYRSGLFLFFVGLVVPMYQHTTPFPPYFLLPCEAPQ